jgi:hypothetical protein
MEQSMQQEGAGGDVESRSFLFEATVLLDDTRIGKDAEDGVRQAEWSNVDGFVEIAVPVDLGALGIPPLRPGRRKPNLVGGRHPSRPGQPRFPSGH